MITTAWKLSGEGGTHYFERTQDAMDTVRNTYSKLGRTTKSDTTGLITVTFFDETKHPIHYDLEKIEILDQETHL